ncbi:hypothetical protein ABW21_db0200911 [Orbilia brochopaga]|nr:hypothetical protein ABW21_db0200911 [Drechslerella brochopaga]
MVSTTTDGAAFAHRSFKKPEALRRLQDTIRMPPPSSLRPVSSTGTFDVYPTWYAVNKQPSETSDPQGLLKEISRAALYHKYANVLGIENYVVRKMKKYLMLRYWEKEDLEDYNLRRKEVSDRLVEELNVGLRNYATRLTNQLRSKKIPDEDVPRKTRTYQAFLSIHDAVYRMGNHKVSGWLLYKIAEGLMREIIRERKEKNKELAKVKKEKRKIKLEIKKQKTHLLKKLKARQMMAAEKSDTRRSLIVILKLDPEKLKMFPHGEAVDLTLPDAANDDTFNPTNGEGDTSQAMAVDGASANTIIPPIDPNVAISSIHPDATISEITQQPAKEPEATKILPNGKKSLVVILKIGKENLKKLMDEWSKQKPEAGPVKKKAKIEARAGSRVSARLKAQEEPKSLIVKLKLGKKNAKKLVKTHGP